MMLLGGALITALSFLLAPLDDHTAQAVRWAVFTFGVVCAAAAVLVLSTLYWGVFGFADITNVYLQVRANETAVTEAAARGESSVTVPYIETLTRYSALYDLKYLDTEDAQSWPNGAMADVLGIGEIRCEPETAKEAE